MSRTRLFPRCVLFSGLLSTRVVASCVPPIVAASQRALVARFQKTITVLYTPTRVRSSISTLAEKPIPRGIDLTLRGLAPFPVGVRRTPLAIPTPGPQILVLKSSSFLLRGRDPAARTCLQADQCSKCGWHHLLDQVRFDNRAEHHRLGETGDRFVNRNSSRANERRSSSEQVGFVPSPPVVPSGYSATTVGRSHAEYTSGTGKMVKSHHGAATVSGE